jgi:predicted MPP superfamily phosphohydrolase
MTTFRWLHLTDLHLGMPGQASLWPNVEEIFLDDLDFLRQEVGPWSVVLFTGDLTRRGTEPEFTEIDKLLDKFWCRFGKWGFTPELLAIPGNHDLIRHEDQTNPSLLTLLHNWHLPDVQTPFWDKEDSPQRALISTVFQNYVQWWEHTPIPKPDVLNGLLPGDCSVSFEVGDSKLGIVGLNTAYLQLAAGYFMNKLHLDVRQLHAACNGNGADWAKQHDICLLLTHHPDTWLSTEAQRHFAAEIHFPPERFALHLFGHMHEGNLTAVSHGGGNLRRRYQGASLFGLESWGEKGEKRAHGYSLCELKLENNEFRLRIWPRCSSDKQGGGRKLDRDLSFDLDKRDGGTKSVVVKQLNLKEMVQDKPVEQVLTLNGLLPK